VSRSPGKELLISTTLMSRLSTRPPLNPDSRPTVVPILRDMTTIIAGMSRESRAPKIILERTSRPNLSVPRR
jgi:hypothetical protein